MKKPKSLERALRITKRWTLTSDVFQMRLAAAQVEKQKFHLEKLRRLVDERSFLLELMKKCAKGQNVAIRLGRNIKHVHAEFEKEKGRYNEVEGPNDPLPNQIDASISTISLQCWWAADLAPSKKRTAIDLVNLVERCKEEEALVEQEMQNVIGWYCRQHHILKDALSVSTMPPGFAATLIQEGLYTEFQIMKFIKRFNLYIDTAEPPKHFRTLVSLDGKTENDESV